jgi:fucose 4-O-acetylase-like acetyltransferase
MSNKDDHCLSALAGLGIILVVFGHSEPLPEYLLRQNQGSTGALALHQVIAWIYTFHMPLFFAMAGYAYAKFTAPKGQGLLQFLRVKTERLLLPYVVLSSLAYPVKVAISRFAQRPTRFRVLEFGQQLLFPWHNVIISLWFLPTLLLILVLCKLILDRRPGSFLYCAVLLASGISFRLFQPQNDTGWGSLLNCYGVLHYFVFAWTGVVIARFREEELIRRFGCWLAPVSVTIFIIRHRIGGGSFVMLLISIAGLVAVWSFAYRYYSRVLDYLGNWSYTIYLLSWFPQILCRILAHQIFHLPLVLVVMSLFASGMAIPLAVGIWLQKHNWPVIQKICGVPLMGPKRPEVLSPPQKVLDHASCA